MLIDARKEILCMRKNIEIDIEHPGKFDPPPLNRKERRKHIKRPKRIKI